MALKWVYDTILIFWLEGMMVEMVGKTDLQVSEHAVSCRATWSCDLSYKENLFNMIDQN